MRLFVAASWCDGMFREEKTKATADFRRFPPILLSPKIWGRRRGEAATAMEAIVRNERRMNADACHS
jgi:hypothetical protein